ncbi:AAEL010559-PA, related, partial [Eimeria acervulina]
ICTCLRGPPLDMSLTVAQLRNLTLAKLVKRIANRQQHLLALRICSYTGNSSRDVLLLWAVAKISSSAALTDEELAEAVCCRLHAAATLPPAVAAAAAAAAPLPAPPVVSPAAAAAAEENGSNTQLQRGPLKCMQRMQQQQQQHLLLQQQLLQQPLPFGMLSLCAAQAGRPVLATRLAAFEEEPKAQVTLLLKLAKVSLATKKAAEAADRDLLLLCIAAALAADADSVDGRMDMSQLVDALKDIPAAQNAFDIFCRQTSQLQLLEQYYERVVAAEEAGLCCLSLAEAAAAAADGAATAAAAAAEWEQQRGWLAYAAGFFAAAKETELFAAVAHAETVGALELLAVQGLRNRMEFSEADRLKKLFKVNDSRYWRCKIDALADGLHFDELQAFAKFRTSPIGYEPFVEACLRKGNKELALQLAYKVKDAAAKARFLAALGREDEAAAALQTPQQGVGGGFFQTISGAIWRRGGIRE